VCVTQTSVLNRYRVCILNGLFKLPFDVTSLNLDTTIEKWK